MPRVLGKWLQSNLDRHLRKNHSNLVLQFPFTSMTMNKDYASRRHRDANNAVNAYEGKVPLKDRTYPFLRMTTVNL